MHQSLVRLLECARLATEHSPLAKRVTDERGLRDALGASSATMTNRKSRGVSVAAARRAQVLWRCSAEWVLRGVEPVWIHTPDPSAPHTRGQAQQVSYPGSTVVPTIRWEDLMATELPSTFAVHAIDDSMAPSIPAGKLLFFDSSVEPVAGDVVIVRDQAGHHYIREYRIKRAAVWTAYATNEAYQALDSAADGLAVTAVLIGEYGRRGRAP